MIVNSDHSSPRWFSIGVPDKAIFVSDFRCLTAFVVFAALFFTFCDSSSTIVWKTSSS
ncbi:MAG: hypothetical protein U5K84_10700 [Alkalibacterium sp.]|nr:hypothetical protein [Alkalibacterium sp.]